MNQTKWTQNNLFGTLDAVISHLDEWGACGVMVQREDLEAWRDTVLHLRSLLREVCEAAEHVPIWGSDGHARYACAACEFQRVKGAELVHHAPDCPVGTAKKFLGIDQ